MTASDTIVAIATPPGQGALGVVRLSGADAVLITERIFKGEKRGGAMKLESHRMYYGSIVDGGKVVDEVMLCCMLAPRSFTREDVVEIYAHGGALTLRGVLEAALHNGARLALPGEFTKRAFLNGRINLSQAEAVMDIIGAGSEAARAAGLRQLGGGLSGRISACRDVILRWLAHIALSVDYPEHEEEAMNRDVILAEGQALLGDMRALLQTAAIGRVLREGIKTAIIGPPNAGKSTLLNAILGEDRAIVHELPGTTRDVLTEQIRVGEVSLVLTDTAGLREADNPVERMGVERSRAAAREAELVFYVVDGVLEDDVDEKTTGALPPHPHKLFEKSLNKNFSFFDGQTVIFLVNKCDQGLSEYWASFIDKKSDGMTVIPVSAKTGQGLDLLYNAIKAKFLDSLNAAKIGDFVETDIITRERHRLLLEEAIRFVEAGLGDFEAGVTEDIAAIHLRSAYLSLGHILGLEYADDIIERIFAEFCVGK